MRFSFLFLICLLLGLPAAATEVFVGNRVYEGTVYGSSTEVRFVLSELADALGVEAKLLDDSWTLNGVPVVTAEIQNEIWIDMNALPKELVRVVRNKDMDTIDIYLVSGIEDGPKDDWGEGGTLVFFYADWSEACIAMEQTMAYVAQSASLKVEFLNVDYPNSAVYRKYARQFSGEEIPYFLVLDRRGRKIESFSGFFTYGELLDKLTAIFSKSK